MIKYEIMINWARFDYLDRLKIEPGCTISRFILEPEVVESFYNIEEAAFAFNKYETSIKTVGTGKLIFYSVTEYYLQRNIYDKNGDFSACDMLYGFSPISIKLVEKDSERIVRTLNSFSKAERVKKRLEKINSNKQYYFSFNA